MHFSDGWSIFYMEKFKMVLFKILLIVMEQLLAKVAQYPTVRILRGNKKVLSSPAVSAWPGSCLQVKEGSIGGKWDLRFNESVFHHSFAVKLNPHILQAARKLFLSSQYCHQDLQPWKYISITAKSANGWTFPYVSNQVLKEIFKEIQKFCALFLL